MAWVSPRAWVNGLVTAAMMNEVSASLNAVGDKPPAYTPVVSAGPDSNYTIAGTNQEVGKWTTFSVELTFTGTPAALGGGIINVSLPSTPSTDYTFGAPLGQWTAFDSSGFAVTSGVATLTGSNVTGFYGATRLTITSPYTLTTADIVRFSGRYYRD